MTSSLRERSRHLLRSELAEAMYDVFASGGFEAVTVEDAAAQAGISRATFFRYFSSKEDAVLTAVEASDFDLADAVRALELVPHETVWQAIRRALEPQAERALLTRDRALSRLRMIMAVDSIRARLAERRFRQEDRLAEVIIQRLGVEEEDARTTAALAITAMDLSWRSWARQDHRELTDVMDDVFHTVTEVPALRPR